MQQTAIIKCVLFNIYPHKNPACFCSLLLTGLLYHPFSFTSTMSKLHQWRSQAGAHWGTCPSNWRLCPTSVGAPEIIGAECTVINPKLHKGFKIKLRSIAICILRIARSCMLP